MKVIIQKIWTEPAVAIGLVVSVALTVFAILNHDMNASSIAGCIAPLVSSLGIRQFVSPVAKTPAPPAPPTAKGKGW